MTKTILLTNDDGVQAAGLGLLAAELAADRLHRVFIVAPERERSAVGHAITLHKPLQVRRVANGLPVAGVWSVSGTPVDCTKLAVKALLPSSPDLIISGINLGANLGTDVYYSGTVSAAIEGTLLGIPSLAVSLVGEEGADFSEAASLALRIAGEILRRGLPDRTLLNVNVPTGSTLGVRVTRLGRRTYQDVFDARQDPRGRTYYWLGGGVQSEEGEEGTDTRAIAEGYASVTPLRLSLTNHEFLSELAGWDL